MLRSRGRGVVSQTERCERGFEANAKPLPQGPIFGKIKTVVFLLVACVTLAPFFAALVPTAHADITYVYDAAGRLQYLIDGSGNVVTYTYDPDGDILQVQTTQPSGVNVYELSPNNGPVGTSVTIYGTGFSTNCSSNTVTFNGTAATVTLCSAATIWTTVPSGATTGAVSVTSPLGLGTGPSFTVN